MTSRRALAASLVALAAAGCALRSWDEFTTPLLASEADSGASAGSKDAGPLDGAAADAAGDAGAPNAYAAAVLADHPVAYYRFEDDALAAAAKSDVGGPLAVATGTEFGAPGVAGNAATFDGSSVLDLSDSFDFAGKVPFSIELWVRAKPRNLDQMLFHKRREGSGQMLGYIGYIGSDGTAHFEGWGNSMSLSSWTDAPLPPSFTHVVLTVSYATGKGNATLWIDAARAPHAGFDNTVDLADTTTPLTVGRDLVGAIDELAIYDKELPRDRIDAHHRAGQPQ